MPMKNPPHPGDFIRTEIIAPAGLSVTAAAAALGVSRPALSSLLNGKAGLSGDMALRIEKAFGVRMDTLMRMQSSYDIAQTRKREKTIHVQQILPATTGFIVGMSAAVSIPQREKTVRKQRASLPMTDQEDVLVSESRRHEESIPIEQVEAKLIRNSRLRA
jgi:addiction module HigA family antidote